MREPGITHSRIYGCVELHIVISSVNGCLIFLFYNFTQTTACFLIFSKVNIIFLCVYIIYIHTYVYICLHVIHTYNGVGLMAVSLLRLQTTEIKNYLIHLLWFPQFPFNFNEPWSRTLHFPPIWSGFIRFDNCFLLAILSCSKSFSTVRSPQKFKTSTCALPLIYSGPTAESLSV